MEFLHEKATQCPKCKCETLEKYDNKSKAYCKNCHSYFEIYTFDKKECKTT